MPDHPKLLIVDPQSDAAERINSLLRNSGINIRINRIANVSEAKASMSPGEAFLLILTPGSLDRSPAREVFDLAARAHIRIAVIVNDDGLDTAMTASGLGTFVLLRHGNDEQLLACVRTELEQHQLQSKLTATESRLDELGKQYRTLLDGSVEATAYIHEGLHVYANPAYLDAVGASELRDLSTVSLIELATVIELDFKQLLRDMAAGTLPSAPVSATVQPLEGKPFEAKLAFSAARFEGEDCVQLVLRLEDEQARLKSELDRLRNHDPLTGLPNRSAFLRLLEEKLDSENIGDGETALFYLEPRHGADLQHELGVTAFDVLMSQLSGAVRDSIDDSDVAARFSDQGIAILARRKHRKSLRELAEEVITRFSNKQKAADQSRNELPCSIGASLIGAQTRSHEECIAQARQAYLDAADQDAGIRFWKPPGVQAETGSDEAHWSETIRFALNSNDIYSVQQSIVGLEGESEGIFENKTYLRNDGREIPSETFLPHAERLDLGAAIDRHVIPGLLKSIAGTGDQHIIALSENSILDFSFPNWFKRQLDEFGVQPSQLILQLRAGAAASETRACERLLAEFQGTGCAFSLSEFDDQAQHCALLELLPVRWIKLRSGLAPSIASNAEHREVVRTVATAAERAHARVMADEVQDAADLAVLWQCGVKWVSGSFLKSPPRVAGQ